MPESRTILSHVSSEDFEPRAREALEKLGYEIVAAGNERSPADLWLVDDELFGLIDRHARPPVPVVVLSRDPAPLAEDPCVVDVLRSPARFHSLYVVLQTALEATPRRFPRVTTKLVAWCAYGRRICIGSLISISEGGCVFRGDRALPAGRDAYLLFSIAPGRKLKLRACTAYRKGRDLGLAFLDLDPDDRSAIAQYVIDQLLAE